VRLFLNVPTVHNEPPGYRYLLGTELGRMQVFQGVWPGTISWDPCPCHRETKTTVVPWQGTPYLSSFKVASWSRALWSHVLRVWNSLTLFSLWTCDENVHIWTQYLLFEHFERICMLRDVLTTNSRQCMSTSELNTYWMFEHFERICMLRDVLTTNSRQCNCRYCRRLFTV